MYADAHLKPWSDALRDQLEGISLFDAHTHIGSNDPDGFRSTPADLLDALALTQSRAVVIPMHEPDGYAAANDMLLAEAERSDGRLVAFCRLDPATDALSEAKRCVEAGARGLKLHPRSEGFQLDDSRLDDVFSFADANRLPVLVHAGRGIPALGKHALERCSTYPGVRLILAHAAISDLSWIWRHLDDAPNLFLDSAWWGPDDLLAMFAFVPPGRILFGSDVPYATSVQGFIATFRSALQVGLTREQVRSVAGEQIERLVAGEEPLDLGPAPGDERVRHDLILDRVNGYLMLAIGQIGAGRSGRRPIGLARLACDVPDDAPQAAVCRSILALLDRHEAHLHERETEGPTNYSNMHPLAIATVVARTPDVPLPMIDQAD